jgi:protein-tyrosine phosphatase
MSSSLNGRRHLAFEACLNARDLGGYRTADGRETRWGALVRSDALSRLTDAGVDALVAHGVRTIVDLRHRGELEPDPCGWAVAHGVRYFNVPLLDVDDAELVAAVYGAQQRDGSYRLMVERCSAGIASAVAAVASAPEGGVLVHCQIGRDRTGLVSALLLRVAGVPTETVVADYALSEAALANLFDRLMAEAADRDDRERIDRERTAPAAAMVATLRLIDERYGGVEPYLLRAGVTATELKRVRERLLA